MTDQQPMMFPPDKVSIVAYYEAETAACTSLEIRLNADGLGRDDLTHAVRLAFQPGPLPQRPPSQFTASNRELGATDVMPKVRDIVPHRSDNSSPGATTTRLTIPISQR